MTNFRIIVNYGNCQGRRQSTKITIWKPYCAASVEYRALQTSFDLELPVFSSNSSVKSYGH